MSTTHIEKWFVFNLGVSIWHETTTPTGPWLDNGPSKESWFVMERGGFKRPINVKERLDYDDGGSIKYTFDSGETLFISNQMDSDEQQDKWGEDNAYKLQ